MLQRFPLLPELLLLIPRRYPISAEKPSRHKEQEGFRLFELQIWLLHPEVLQADMV